MTTTQEASGGNPGEHRRIVNSVNVGDGQGSAPAIQQDGKLFLPGSILFNQVLVNQNVWTTESLLSLAEQDFRTLIDLDDHPDFSANGSSIKFGFVRQNSGTGPGYSIDAGIDNWSITVTTVPIPAAVWLLG